MTGYFLFILIAFFSFSLLSTIIKSILKRNWILLHTTFNEENYFRITGKLKEAGVNYRTEIPVNVRARNFNENKQFDIYVKKEEEYKAASALRI
ncbi:hypothetical protein [Fictibacillus barbaricus]|uniref:Uncharacterized protein n=1 Tax=Fictibacillus barbaricus TaxID=182136 RepID=A0ABU1TWV7_9BACL|nr:hypothetical protein [Fictibacillus barbaricus]MDR7071711.1 hypothetical protein [Fictibacillus barbaricus]